MAAIASSLAPADASARSGESRVQVDVAAAPLPEAIDALARAAQVSIGTDGTLPRHTSPAVRGKMRVSEALARMLAGSGYAARQVGPTAWRIERLAPAIPPQERAPIDAPDERDNPIVVTATKRPALLSTLPNAVTVVLVGKDVPASPGDGTELVAREIDGMSMTAMGPGRNKIFLRGVADSAFDGETQSTVAVLVNDARATYSAPDPDLRLVDVERVEVLKGPQGSLYGTGTLGGIYQIRTNLPDLDHGSLELAASGEAGTSSEFGVSGSVVANLPLESGTAGLRLVGYAGREPGWIDTGSRPDSNSSKVLGGRANLAVEAGGWRLDVMGLSQRLEAADTQYVYEPGVRTRSYQLAEPHDNDFDLVSLHAAHELGTGQLVLSSSYGWHEVTDVFDATIGAESLGVPDPGLFTDARHYRVWNSEARLTGSANWGEWLVGLSHVEAHESGDSTLQSLDQRIVSPIEEDTRQSSENAIFGNVSVPVTADLTAEAGGRLFLSDVTDRRQLLGQSGSVEQRRFGITPSAAIAWTPREGRTIYLRYGSAFRPGGAEVDASGKPDSYAGDELSTIEAGWREQIVGGGRLELGAYYTWWSHMQSDMLLPTGLIETQNAGEARILGAEISLSQPLDASWDLSAGGTWQDAQLVRNDLGIALEDTRLPVVPVYTLRAAIGRAFTVAGAHGSLHAKLRYVGPARLSFDPALDQPMGNVLESRIEGRVNLPPFDLSLTIENVLNRSADTFAFGNPFRAFSMRQYTPQQPLLVTLGIRREL